ncbi:hypothetical protein [Kitasatospora sp. NPDC093558]|uniref:hypothetical protein n=1 Tax=Kitasatospora sp. NPDC093558 TaxID=3155201 RepID=UPI003417A1A0
MSAVRTAADGRVAVRCYVYSREAGAGTWSLGLLPEEAPHSDVLPGDVLPGELLPGELLPDGADPAAAALRLASRLTGRTASLVTPPVPPLERPGRAGTAVPPWWLRASEDGPYELAYEYVTTVPGPPPAGLRWLAPADARALARPQDENLRLAAALGDVMEALLAGQVTPAAIRAMTLGHSRRGVGGPRTSPQW